MKKTVFCSLLFVFLFGAFVLHAAGDLVLVNEAFTRGTGNPVAVVHSFPGVSGPATIKLWNGDAEDSTEERVSSSVITVNGTTVLSSSNFNQNIYYLEKPITLTEGSNTLSVLLKSKPGGTIRVQIIQSVEAESAAVVGQAGGIVEVINPSSPIYGVKVDVPAGALTQAKIITINEKKNPPPFENGDSPLGTAVEIGPRGAIFAQPVTITLNYDYNKIREMGILGEQCLRIFTFNSEGFWEPIELEKIDSNSKMISAKTNHFSTFAVYGGAKLIRHRRTVAEPTTEYVPLLFVHGVQASADDTLLGIAMGNAIKTFGSALDLLYFENVDVFALEYNSWSSISDSAVSLALAIKKIKQITGRDKVNIVAHSMGGLVSRAYAQNMADPNPRMDDTLRQTLIPRSRWNHDIKKIMMLGTPNHGSNWANVGDWVYSKFRLATSFSQMEGPSEFLKNLNCTDLPESASSATSGPTRMPRQLNILVGYGWHTFGWGFFGDGVVSEESVRLCPEHCQNGYRFSSYHEFPMKDYYHIPLIREAWPIGIAHVTGEDHLIYPIMRTFAKDPVTTQQDELGFMVQRYYPDNYFVSVSARVSGISFNSMTGPNINNVFENSNEIVANLSARPTIGDKYTVVVNYSDGRSEERVFIVSGVNDQFPQFTFPADNSTIATTSPTFVWQECTNAQHYHFIIAEIIG